MRDLIAQLARLHDDIEDSFVGALIGALVLFVMLVAGMSIWGGR